MVFFSSVPLTGLQYITLIIFELLVVRASKFFNLILLYCPNCDGTDTRSGWRVIAGENKLD